MWDTPAGLLGEPLLYHGNGVENWAQWFSAVGAPRERLKLASGFDQVSLLVRAVMADMGIAVLQRCLVRDDLLAGRVAAPFPAAGAHRPRLPSLRAATAARPLRWPASGNGCWIPPARIRTWRRQEARPPCSSPALCRACAGRQT